VSKREKLEAIALSEKKRLEKELAQLQNKFPSQSNNVVAERNVISKSVHETVKERESHEEITEYLTSKLLHADSDDDFTFDLLHIKNEVKDFLLNTFQSHSRNHSLLLIGERGSGKSSALLAALSQSDSQLVSSINQSLCIIKLDGWIHNTESSALKHLAHQLQSSFPTQTNAPTNQSTMLEDMDQNDDEDVEEHAAMNQLKPNMQSNSTLILGCIEKCLKAHIEFGTNLVFILDRFERFAEFRPQTFLYRLFNLLQPTSESTQTADKQLKAVLIGLTSHIDVVDALEKRVKSRFSHRIRFIPQKYRTVDVLNVIANRLMLPETHSNLESFKTHVNQLLNSENVAELISRILFRRRSLGVIFHVFALALQFTADIHNFNIQNLQKAVELTIESPEFSLSSKTAVLSLSRLEMLLLVSLYKLESASISRTTTAASHSLSSSSNRTKSAFTFDEMYTEYAQQSRGEERFQRSVSLVAFERLISGKFIVFSDISRNNASVTSTVTTKASLRPKHTRPVRLNVPLDVIKSCIPIHPMLTESVKHWTTL